MCLGIPMQLITCNGIAGTCQTRNGSRTELIDLSLVGPQKPGIWLLTFLGAAREVISDRDAALIDDALGGLHAVMTGQDMGAAFADLDARSPALPPHLQAAQAAGKTTA